MTTYTWTDNAMQGGAACDVDKVNDNLMYLKDAIANITGGVEYVQNFIGNQDIDTEHDIKLERVNSNHPAYIQVTNGSGSYKTIKYEGSGIIKAIDAEWIEGATAGTGGLVNGVSLASDLCLYMFLLYDSTNEEFDAVFDSSVSGANILDDTDIINANYDYYSVVPIHSLPPLDASSDIIDHIAREIEGGGLLVKYSFPSGASAITDVSTFSTSYADTTITAPPDTIAQIAIRVEGNYYIFAVEKTTNSERAAKNNRIDFEIELDSNSQIQTKINNASATNPRLYTQGYKLTRRP